MLPLKIVIPGRYWDSFIYKGALYLWDINGSIRTIDWNQLVSSEWDLDGSDGLAMHCAFLRNDYLYVQNERRNLLFRAPEVQNLLKKMFAQLSSSSMNVDLDTLSGHEKGQQDNLFPFPHADLDVYNRRVYVAGSSGVKNATIGQGTKLPISTRLHQQWDAPVLRISAGYGSLALAAGDEGLFESSLNTKYWRGSRVVNGDPDHISGEACFDCNWTYWSIFASNKNGGFLASYRKEISDSDAESEYFRHQDDYTSEDSRIFNRVISCEEIWGQQSLTWGVRDKFCLAHGTDIDIIRYQPWGPAEEMQQIGTITIEQLKQKEIVSASIAPFGIVVELSDAILVHTSVGNVIVLNGEPSNWRVFPRALNYFNQLHILRDDCLEIYSFSDDYFADQQAKVAGFKVRNLRSSGPRFKERAVPAR